MATENVRVTQATACAGKQAFTSAGEARRAVERFRDRSVSHYRCMFCGMWHFGHRIGLRERRVSRLRYA